MRILITLPIVLTITLGLSTAIAGPSKSEKKAVQTAMKKYVNAHIDANGMLPVVHQGKILKLKLATSKKYPDAFHAGVKNEGQLYASCADFKSASGDKYDIDFLVSRVGKRYVVVQPIVHSVNGKKSPYDLAH